MPEEPPLLSVVTASFNSADTLKETLRSVRMQESGLIEHVVIDGGSRDGTVELLRESEENCNLIWVSEPDRGIADALNKGIQMASGKYILVIQADDHLLESKVLAGIWSLLQGEEYDILSFPVVVRDASGGEFVHRPSRYVNLRYHFKNVFRHQGTFVHRRLYDRVGVFSEDYRISMDYDFFYRALKQGCSFYRGRQPLAVMGAGGISRTESHSRIREEFLVQDNNETVIYWRWAQRIFRIAYIPYREAVHRWSPPG